MARRRARLSAAGRRRAAAGAERPAGSSGGEVVGAAYCWFAAPVVTEAWGMAGAVTWSSRAAALALAAFHHFFGMEVTWK